MSPSAVVACGCQPPRAFAGCVSFPSCRSTGSLLPPTRVMSARYYAVEKTFLDKPVQRSELRCVALKVQQLLCLFVLRRFLLLQECAVLLQQFAVSYCCNLHKTESCCSLSKGDSFCCSSVQCLSAATCAKRRPSAASSDLGSRWPSVVVAAAGVGSSLYCS